MNEILKLNEISGKVNSILTKDKYSITSEAKNPCAIILRSFSMHEYQLPAGVIAVARAGAGVNNIPLDKMSEKGVCVFNTPGANANAVKELVLFALLVSSRKIYEGINWTQNLEKNGEVAKQVEKGKKAFVGQEILGKTLGIVGLGAIGRLVANAVLALGMKVIAYDPFVSSTDLPIELTTDINEVYKNSDYITLHVPATPQTKNSINKETIAIMKDNVRIINLARGELVNNEDIKKAIADKKVAKYVTDLPCDELLGVDGVITIPHLGASTEEAEDNCAVMAAAQLKDYLENGNIVNSVNFPKLQVERNGKQRVCVISNDVQNAVADVTATLKNVSAIASATRGNIVYVIADLSDKAEASAIDALKTKAIAVRVL
ncbi:MAG: 3-phosphoglycerate dehydrogenase [Clostridia bacterium]|nr:3-phosphoglycerate dehydrogenase [Clostridia bacterium]MDE7329427.1 3-phosphoglycerate dehydrogenase [Clostridia bacterium]